MAPESLLLTAGAVVTGLIVGRLRGGRFGELRRLRVRALLLLLVGVAGAAIGTTADLERPATVVAVSLGLVIGFCLLNLRLVGMPIITLGLAMNLAPLVVDGAIPVRADALVQAGLVDEGRADTAVLDGPKRPAGPDDRLPWLGDVIPVRATGQVLSFGDLVLLVGIADTVSHFLDRRRRRVGVALDPRAEAVLASIALPEDRIAEPPVVSPAQVAGARAGSLQPPPEPLSLTVPGTIPAHDLRTPAGTIEVLDVSDVSRHPA